MCVLGGGSVGESWGELLKDAVCEVALVSAPLWYVTCKPLFCGTGA